PTRIPTQFSWGELVRQDGAELEDQYRKTLLGLGKGTGLIPTIFRKAQNRIQDPAKLKRLVTLIDGEIWLGLDLDIKADIYEGLLEKNAQDTKSGAGQYFTPRPLIDAMIAVMQPKPGMTITDPAAGTGGFLIEAHKYVSKQHSLDRYQERHLNHDALRGWEIVDNTARLCVMNLYLHGIAHDGDTSPITVADALAKRPSERFDMVLTNPPFGKKSSVTIINDAGESVRESLTIEREDFWTSTSNKQLNFLQHIRGILKNNGRAAVVLPDNVLFEAGAGETVRHSLLHETNLHTILRLPTGIFYAQGVKANVLFFDNRPSAKSPWTETVWYYDLRTNKHFTLKKNPLRLSDLQEFIDCYQAGRPLEKRTPTWSDDNPDGRWRSYSYDELLARDKANLDLFWLRDDSLEDSADLPDPDVIADEMIEELQAALEQLRLISADLGGD
ncbi:MAG: HsdM family class I SAM-dependent methyltransferase, partial [Candidatus Promineifilaceae bacterium]